MSSRYNHTALFRQSSSLYDAIAAENYRLHRELYSRVAELLKSRVAKAPYSILDLDSGNARFLAPCLQSSPSKSYNGVDLSTVALKEAREYLNEITVVSLRNHYMLDAVSETSGLHDLIFSDYAVFKSVDSAGEIATALLHP